MSANSQHKPATISAYDYLVRALQLLEQPRYSRPTAPQQHGQPGHKVADHSWIRNAEAFSDHTGTWVKPEDERATAWCTIGVVKAVTKYDPEPELAYKYCLSVLNAANPAYIAEGSSQAQPALNDSGSYELVRRFFQRAISLAAKWQQVES